MSRLIVLIGCCHQQLDRPARAEKLFVSSLFRASLAYAKAIDADQVFALSAKHGLVPMDEVIEPYAQVINPDRAGRKGWSERVLRQIGDEGLEAGSDRFVVLAGRKYREYLVPALSQVEVPMKGMGIVKQMKFLSQGAKA